MQRRAEDVAMRSDQELQMPATSGLKPQTAVESPCPHSNGPWGEGREWRLDSSFLFRFPGKHLGESRRPGWRHPQVSSCFPLATPNSATSREPSQLSICGSKMYSRPAYQHLSQKGWEQVSRAEAHANMLW